jgi:hypothetical protein
MRTRACSAFLFLTVLGLLGGVGLYPTATHRIESATTEAVLCAYGYEPYGCAAPMLNGGDLSLLARM